MNNTSHLYVIAAPSGSGKTSLVKALASSVNNIQISISHTTRPMRPGENHGVDYHFVSEAQFKKMIQAEEFLEYAQVYDYYYGTSKEWIFKQLQEDRDVILEIDWQGARSIHRLFPQAILIFILPPSQEALLERLTKRRQDHEEVIQKRLAAAKEDISHYSEFDYIILNDTFEHALIDLQNIVKTQRLRLDFQKKNLAPLLADWLQKK